MISTFQSLIFVMSLSGSLISLVWLFIHKIYFQEFKAKWLRNLILMAAPFFLIPVPLLRNLFSRPLIAAGVMPAPLVRKMEGILDRTYMILGQGDVAALSSEEKFVLALTVAAALISCGCVTYQVYLYWKLRRAIRHNVRLPVSQRETRLLAEAKRKMQINKDIRLIKSSKAAGPFTMGIIHPVIVIPESMPATNDALQMVFGHELAHIKHKDGFFTFIACVILAMHWFNLFCVIYLHLLKEANELYSDETVMEMLPEMDRLAYCRLLLQLASIEDEEKNLFSSDFSKGSAKKQMQRRIDNIMRGKKHRFGMAVALGSLMLSIGFGSTFVYAGATEVEVANNTSSISSEKELCFNSTEFHAEDSHAAPTETIAEIPFDKYFTDEDGNVFPCDEIQSRVLCIHSYVTGTVSAHEKIGTGCKMEFYHAKRCKICGKTVIYDLYYTGTWKTCPH